MSKKIYLSPSMQPNNVYAYGNTNEQEECNKIASFAKLSLERYGFDVKQAPKGQSITKSVEESNSWNSDLHIAIHTNAFDSKTLGGTLVMIYSSEEKNKKAGEAILNSVAPISPGNDYSLKVNPSLLELRSTKCVAVYLEVEFHDTLEGAKWIVSNNKNIGEAICKGVCDYFGIAYEKEQDDGFYKVQIGAFKDKLGAQKQLEKAKECGFSDAFITKS